MYVFLFFIFCLFIQEICEVEHNFINEHTNEILFSPLSMPTLKFALMMKNPMQFFTSFSSH